MKSLMLMTLALLPLASQQMLGAENKPVNLGADKTDIFAIPADTSPTEERIQRERLKEMEKELQEEAEKEGE